MPAEPRGPNKFRVRIELMRGCIHRSSFEDGTSWGLMWMAGGRSFERRISSVIRCHQLNSHRLGTGTTSMVAPQAMRTVWLALLCLIGLTTTLVVKFAVSRNELAKALPSTKAEVLPKSALTDAIEQSSETLMARTKLQN